MAGSIQSKDPKDVAPSDWSDQMFYVRSAKVPEPSTILIFAIALIALSLRKRAIK